MFLDVLLNPPAVLVWGLLSRGLGLVFLISFASLSAQILPMAGARGITPLADSLRAIERDFPSWRRYAYFPSLSWLSASDAFLSALPKLGMLAAISCIVGGPHAPYAFAFCYLAYLSLDRPIVLVYPWDCLLFEAGFWGMFLPASHVLPSFSTVAAPLPAVAWVYRLLVLRVIVGFGKHKFAGYTKQDSGFLKSFLANQPLPTPIGWLSQKLPLPALKLGLFLMFLVELPLPIAVFFPGPWCSAIGLFLAAFMVAIEVTGNFGYFNLAMIVVSLSWLDNTTARAFSFAGFFSESGPWFVHGVVALHTLLALIAFPFNTFCAQTFSLWSVWKRVRPGFLVWPFAFARALHPLRFVHAYGVFPPRSAIPGKLMPVIEATWDDREWHALRFAHAPTTESSRPTWCAPHHNRFDQAVVYEGLGLNESSVFRNIVGRWDPYGYGGVPAARMLLHRILEGNVPGQGFYDRTLERERGRPLAVRAGSYLFEPTTLAEAKESGRYWRRTQVGPHFGTLRHRSAQQHLAPGEDGYWDEPLPTPELWHYDDVIWLERSKLGRLMKRAERGEDVHALVTADADGLETADVERFWNDFLPRVASRHRADWHSLRATVTELRASYGRPQLHRFERIAARYGVLLFARMQPLFLAAGLPPMLGFGPAAIDVKTNYHLRMLACHIVLHGRAAVDAVMREPLAANQHVPAFSVRSGSYFDALFNYEQLVFRAQRLRALEAFTEFEGRTPPTPAQKGVLDYLQGVVRRAWGAVELGEFLKTQFTDPEDMIDVPETLPHWKLTADHEVVKL